MYTLDDHSEHGAHPTNFAQDAQDAHSAHSAHSVHSAHSAHSAQSLKNVAYLDRFRFLSAIIPEVVLLSEFKNFFSPSSGKIS